MSFQWIAESPPLWNDNKQRLIGGAAEGIFDRRYGGLAPGDLAPGSWWRVEEAGNVVGYGWMDVVWGDAEILLITDPDHRGKGVGGFALDKLEAEASRQGLNYLYNMVRETHPHREKVTAWLVERGFRPSGDGSLVRSCRHR